MILSVNWLPIQSKNIILSSLIGKAVTVECVFASGIDNINSFRLIHVTKCSALHFTLNQTFVQEL